MLIDAVDERDSSWEDHDPRFRVHLFSGGELAGRWWAVTTYDVRQAEVLEAVQWADLGLVWLVGLDANDRPRDEGEKQALRGMHDRRAARRSQPERGTTITGTRECRITREETPPSSTLRSGP